MTRYTIYKQTVLPTGPSLSPISEHSGFKAAWAEALSIFEQAGMAVVGCHYEDDCRYDSYRAEFFVVAVGDPPIHETYIIEEA